MHRTRRRSWRIPRPDWSRARGTRRAAARSPAGWRCMPRSKFASHSALTAAARWKITSAPDRMSGAVARVGSRSSQRSAQIAVTRPSAARSGGTGARSTSVTRERGAASLPATSSEPADSSCRARRAPRKPAPPVITTLVTSSPAWVADWAFNTVIVCPVGRGGGTRWAAAGPIGRRGAAGVGSRDAGRGWPAPGRA